MLYLESNTLLHPAQFAYRKKTMIEEWRKRPDKGYDVIGFHENFIKLIRSYLHKRRVRVKVNNTQLQSQIIDDDLGVSQGSVLGLLLLYFILMILTF